MKSGSELDSCTALRKWSIIQSDLGDDMVMTKKPRDVSNCRVGPPGWKEVFWLSRPGADNCTAIVVTLTAARALGEIMGYRHTLEHTPRQAPWFYSIYTLVLVAAAVIVGGGINMVALGVGVQVMNALLLPIVLGFLYLLARRLPEPYRLQGAYAYAVAVLIALTVGLGLYSGIMGIFTT